MVLTLVFLYVIAGSQKSGGLNRGSSGPGPSGPPPFIPHSSPHGARLPGPPPPGVSLGPPPHIHPPANGGPPPRQILPGTVSHTF